MKAASAAAWKRSAAYAFLLAAGTFALQWLDCLRLARIPSGEAYNVVVAIAFLALGGYVGARVIRRPAAFDGNPKARAALGISPRELEELQELAAGHSNKEIPANLDVSPKYGQGPRRPTVPKARSPA